MTAQDVITLARDEIGDNIEDYRWSDSKMLSALTDACFNLAQDRPDLILKADGTRETVSELSTVYDNLVFGNNEKQALMHFTAYRILSKDSSDDTNMQLAGFHLNNYNGLT